MALNIVLAAVIAIDGVAAAGTARQFADETIGVTNTQNAGSGSLRQATLSANARPGYDTILFDIPGPVGMYVINFQTLLPPITDPVTIDGTSQPGYSAGDRPLIEIRGFEIEKTCAGVLDEDEFFIIHN